MNNVKAYNESIYSIKMSIDNYLLKNQENEMKKQIDDEIIFEDLLGKILNNFRKWDCSRSKILIFKNFKKKIHWI